MRTAFIASAVVFMLSLIGCEARKLGVAGATCGASSDCAGDLQCIDAICVDLRAMTEEHAAEVKAAREVAKSPGKKERIDAAMAEIDSLTVEQLRLEAERTALGDKLLTTDAVDERERLLAAPAGLDEQLAALKRERAAAFDLIKGP